MTFQSRLPALAPTGLRPAASSALRRPAPACGQLDSPRRSAAGTQWRQALQRLLIIACWIGAAIAPAKAIVTSDGQVHALHSLPAPDVSGVGRLDNGCSAVLLQGGRHALSAAHCHTAAGGTVTFASGATAKVARTQLAPGWQGTPGVHDLALMSFTAPVEGATGYPIAAPAAVRLPCIVLIAGWGDGGTGLGAAANGEPQSLRYGYNEYDALLQPIEVYGNRVAMFDFDDGSDAHNTLGRKGLAEYEAMLGSRDSGGPSFVAVGSQWQLAGIHVGIVTSKGTGFGGVGLDLRIAPYAAWITTEMRRAP